MCTVTWLRDHDGYQLLCNRDERKTRGEAHAPTLQQSAAQTAYLAPRDNARRGTWIAANQHGVTLCLLNASGPNLLRPRSRGELPAALIDANSAIQAIATMAELPLENFPAFTLAALDHSPEVHVARWNGSTLDLRTEASKLGILSSSSLDDAKARQTREQLLASLNQRVGRLDGAALLSFHESHGDGDLCYSPCMHREDAETVSFSWLRVERSEVHFFYSPGAPCRWSPGRTWRLACTHT